MQLTIYFDSYCPLCVAEMDRLAELDAKNQLVFEDIHAKDFSERHSHIDPVAADKFLHAQYSDGKMIYGLDVTYQAWSLVGHNKWLAILRWPIIRWFANSGYRLFARYRYGISYALTGQRRCQPCEEQRPGSIPSACELTEKR